MSVSVLVGNCLGMGEPAKAKRVALQMIVIASLGMSVVAALLWPFRAELAALLSHEAGTQAQIINYLTYNLLSTPFSIASTVMGGVMVGAGATRYNLMVYGGTFCWATGCGARPPACSWPCWSRSVYKRPSCFMFCCTATGPALPCAPGTITTTDNNRFP